MMTKKSPCAAASAMLLSWLISIPAHGWAAPEGAGQRAGEVSRVIPAVNIARGGKTIPAAAKTVVNWQDLVNTQVNARARSKPNWNSLMENCGRKRKKSPSPTGNSKYARRPASPASWARTFLWNMRTTR